MVIVKKFEYLILQQEYSVFAKIIAAMHHVASFKNAIRLVTNVIVVKWQWSNSNGSHTFLYLQKMGTITNEHNKLMFYYWIMIDVYIQVSKIISD